VAVRDHIHHDHDRAHGHDHDHAHDHEGGHGAHPHDDHAPGSSPGGKFTAGEARQAKRLLIVLVTVAIFFVGELAGAIAARSEVLKVDALHLLMDVFALAMSLVAMRVAVRRPTARFTFGMRRAEPVAAMFNAGLVIVATVGIVREGIQELLYGASHPNAGIMLYVAMAALVVNGLSAWLLHGAIHQGHDHDQASHDGHEHGHGSHGHGHAMNLRGVWLHLLGDTLGSLAALIAAIVIHFEGPVSIDPIASFLVAAILLFGAFRLIRDATLVLLEAAPLHLPVGAVRQVVGAFPGVLEVHDLHVWTLGAGHDAITVHVRADVNADATLARRISDTVRAKFHVEYVTVQVESESEACDAPPSRFEGE
jgi:cobalt-zinc-cadmium efflux system protein